MAIYLRTFFAAMATMNGIGEVNSLKKSYLIIASAFSVSFVGIIRK
jgi:hypothetical protein